MKKYLYADESGNMDFKCHHTYPGATRYFALGTLAIDGEDNLAGLRTDLVQLRYDLAKSQPSKFTGSFHATQDAQSVRDAVYEVLDGHKFKVDVTLLEKSKAMPHIRSTPPTFFKYAWFYHFKNLSGRYFLPDDDLLVVSAQLGTKKLAQAFRSSVEEVVEQCGAQTINKQIVTWDMKADVVLQAADYVLWAVMREVERGDKRSRFLIEDKVRSVYDLWSRGGKHYYGRLAA